MANKKIKINRAPVLTLWATVVARRLGYNEETALTLGKAVAGLNAQSKGRKLEIYEEKSEEEKEKELESRKSPSKLNSSNPGRGVPAVKTPKGLRAAIDGDPISSESVETYLKQKFKDDYDDARTAMEKLAKAYPPKQLESKAYGLYENFGLRFQREKGLGRKR